MERTNPKEYFRIWREKNREKLRKSQREYYYRNHEKLKARMRANQKKNTEWKKKERKEIRTQIFELLGNKCNNSKCPIPKEKLDLRALQIDHVKGDGWKERPRNNSIGYYKKIYEQILNGSKDYQSLCAYCNWLKRFENSEV